MEQQILTKQTLRFFWRHARKYPRYLAGIALTVPLAVLGLAFLPSLIVSDILQRVSTGEFVKGDVWSSFGPQLVLYGGIIFTAGAAMWRIAVYFGWKLESLVVRNIHREVFDHLMNQSANFHSNRFSGSLVSQANKLANSYVSIADATIYEMTTLSLAFIFAFVILLPRAPLIAILLISIAVVFLFAAVRFTRPVRLLRHKEAAIDAKQTGQLADSITNVMAVKSFAGSGIERKLFAAATKRTQDASLNVLFATLKQDTILAVSTISIATGALVLALVGVVSYGANVGTAFLIITYTGVITQRLWDFARGTLRTYNRAMGDAQEMIRILAIEPEVKDPARPEKVRITRGEIEFKDMQFTHPESRSDDVLFGDFNLHIKPGEKIGLVGHSGSGKSTLTRLLLRFSDVDGGEISIDGQNIAHITQDDLRSHIAYVPQEPLLFHRTIKENIAYGKLDATDKEIAEAAKKAYAHDFIQQLPAGYDTLVGERGVKLSGGQRQRIAIARAILKNAPILVLDEATSALDSESEKLIQAALWELMKGRTAIVIAHRLSTIQKMDRIVVLNDGRLIEEGSHANLLQRKGTYAKLWAHQSGGFIKD